ncbi:glycosyltransferase family A protein [Nonlabens ponticola]|uniref:glycosyltransferase family A protein n=1 Tax=Nonlabens ponticola TaxID=2496866 RepID=UPI0013DEEB46|nr:glycosyltransferase family A protein [Nonlabens ponticola]
MRILESCLKSLINSVHSNTLISVVDNGSCQEVNSFLSEMLKERILDELITTVNIGKLNAILKGVSGHKVDLITISDADILFVKGWQKETADVFLNIKKAAVVGLIPQFKMYSSYSSNLIFDYLFSSKLKFKPVDNPSAMREFYRSIGWKDNYNKNYLKYHLTITHNDVVAVVGSGHAVATYKSEIFTKINHEVSTFKLGGGSESRILDSSALKLDGYRLTTAQNFAYHMGNIFEPWMERTSFEGRPKVSNDHLLSFKNKLEKRPVRFYLKSKMFKRLFKVSIFTRLFLRTKGLTSDIARNY